MNRDDRRRSCFVICKANEVTHALQRERRGGGEDGTGMRFGMGMQQNKTRGLFRKAKSKFLPYICIVMTGDEAGLLFAKQMKWHMPCRGRRGRGWNRNGIWNGNTAEQNERNFSGKKEDAENDSRSWAE
ncbi:hypothetical protein CEXT_128581 [Caerostris extrusa]|uniref:Uncharacterized protein n=1 Tax=Caerostris extrusa TaxID=172846 RepID=A0AAV4RT32_CAEEX|nr:hypothetical protein CEXT_128581 [Caerostris extrusa]